MNYSCSYLILHISSNNYFRSFAIADQKEDGTQGNILACGIIARSAGLFENPKMICACDGVTIWDEEKSKKRAAL